MKLSEAILDDVCIYFYKDLFTLYIWMFCLHGSVCTMHIPCSYRAQKSASDLLELELQIMRHHVGAGNWARAANTLNLRAISCFQLDCIYFLIMIKTPNLKFSFLIINIFLKKFIVFVCTHTLLPAHTCRAMPHADQEQLLEIFLPCGSWRLNSGCQAWLWLAELSPWCSLLIFNLPYSNVKYVFIVVKMVYIILLLLRQLLATLFRLPLIYCMGSSLLP